MPTRSAYAAVSRLAAVSLTARCGPRLTRGATAGSFDGLGPASAYRTTICPSSSVIARGSGCDASVAISPITVS